MEIDESTNSVSSKRPFSHFQYYSFGQIMAHWNRINLLRIVLEMRDYASYMDYSAEYCDKICLNSANLYSQCIFCVHVLL